VDVGSGTGVAAGTGTGTGVDVGSGTGVAAGTGTGTDTGFGTGSTCNGVSFGTIEVDVGSGSDVDVGSGTGISTGSAGNGISIGTAISADADSGAGVDVGSGTAIGGLSCSKKRFVASTYMAAETESGIDASCCIADGPKTGAGSEIGFGISRAIVLGVTVTTGTKIGDSASTFPPHPIRTADNKTTINSIGNPFFIFSLLAFQLIYFKRAMFF
jgi:hypothetical protein